MKLYTIACCLVSHDAGAERESLGCMRAQTWPTILRSFALSRFCCKRGMKKARSLSPNGRANSTLPDSTGPQKSGARTVHARKEPLSHDNLIVGSPASRPIPKAED